MGRKSGCDNDRLSHLLQVFNLSPHSVSLTPCPCSQAAAGLHFWTAEFWTLVGVTEERPIFAGIIESPSLDLQASRPTQKSWGENLSSVGGIILEELYPSMERPYFAIDVTTKISL